MEMGGCENDCGVTGVCSAHRLNLCLSQSQMGSTPVTTVILLIALVESTDLETTAEHGLGNGRQERLPLATERQLERKSSGLSFCRVNL